MTILFVYAHPNPQSFTTSIVSKLVEKAKEKNHDTEIRDLYGLKFNPILSSNDLQELRTGNIPADIEIEQDLITKADVVVMIYQLWWTQFPAMLKGYIDRVFSYGFAYQFGDNGLEGLLKGKKVFLVTNMGTPSNIYDESDMFSALNKTSNVGIFEYCGIETIEHIFNGGVLRVSEETRKEYVHNSVKAFEAFL
ncbi:NAD(P)H-dependent oxidoreductase [uncultured Polaribacter sp.]|uniref:NAD(P)H-dependent oxidoreductase n=1 Tax=uncultured Polaribacter sp. TaxID=174711 RepID=UPI0026326817|nr:NAD(P)H-dependent oxidoreductase [uncultured Polaribacter sp.]